MKKADFKSALRAHVKAQLSPDEQDRKFVSSVYEATQKVLGEANCVQIGSYARFTSIKPLHDLDVLYILGEMPPTIPNPSNLLTQLQRQLSDKFENPTNYVVKFAKQTHSVTLSFLDDGNEVFAVDIVPAYIRGKNEYRQDKYVVPELLAKSRSDRRKLYEGISKGEQKMTWIPTDPRGYIKVASDLNSQNDDFRRAVKFAKGWRGACKTQDDRFPLKSFHLEQLMTRCFRQHPTFDIFDALFEVFCDLPKALQCAQIPDRADPAKMIDSYVNGLGAEEKRIVLESRDYLLIALEELANSGSVSRLLTGDRRQRADSSESYLFDQRIPTLTEQILKIEGRVLGRVGGFRARLLDALGLIEVDRKIEFRTQAVSFQVDHYKWKVKNDDGSSQPRGEITDHKTRNDPEHTKFRGDHYVECYAIRDGVCIAKARQPVVLKNWGDR